MKPSNLLSIEEWLRADFSALAESLGADQPTTHKWTEALISRYAEPQRYYHTTEHINSMLKCCERYRSDIEDELVIKLAIFFHDWIYDPKGKDNERESIKHFQDFASETNLAEQTTVRVSEYIERTITHTLPNRDGEADSDLRMFLDFDLEVLSRSSADYALYAAQIRREYGHFAEVNYCNGRVKVLKSFLERDRLYFSDSFHELYEEVARGNLKEEIEILERNLLPLG